MILRISKMLVMMALPIVLIACGGEKSGLGTKASGMRFVLSEGQTLPTGVTQDDGTATKPASLNFGEVNFVGVDKGPIKYELTNITASPVTFLTTGLTGGRDDIFITASSCLDVLPAKGSCSVDVTLSPKEQNRSYKDTYSVTFEFTDESGETAISEAVELNLEARTFQGSLDETGVPGLSVSTNYDNVKFNNIFLGSTSAPEVVQYFYFGDSEVTLRPTESLVASASAATDTRDGEISVESDCGVLKYGDTCSVQLFYRPAVPSAELPDGNIYSHLNVNILQSGVAELAKNTIEMEKHSTKPDDSLLMTYNSTISDAVIPNTETVAISDTTVPGTISDATSVRLKRTDVQPDIENIFYRLESTNPAILVTRDQCDLVLKNPSETDETGEMGKCDFEIRFSSAAAGPQVGYIIAVAGSERIFLKVKANTTDGAGETIGTDTYTKVDVDSLSLQAEPNMLSATKRIAIRYTGAVLDAFGLPFSMTLTGTDMSLFQYTTTCVDGEGLEFADPVCFVDINFRGNSSGDITDKTASLKISNGTAPDAVIELTGTTVESVVASKETPVKDLSIDAKSHTYPTTGIGLVSQTFTIKLKNDNETAAISGLGTTSTDLTTFTLNNSLGTFCRNTLGAGQECTLSYVFRPRNSLEKTGYISIFDNRTATGLRNNEIIQVVGRGTLFNEYLSFGVVAPNETKTLVASLTNDGITPLVIKSVVAEEFKSEWKTEGFADVKDQPKGNRVALINKYFNRDSFTNKVTTTNQTIKIISSECNGISLDPGASCLMRLEFKPTMDVTTEVGMEHANHYRAYLNVKHADGSTIDRLHVIGSTQDNSTMYMYPEQDFNQALEAKPTTGFEKDNNVSTTTLERNFVVIGNDVYSYLGSSHQSDEGSLFKGDNKLRKYDASRNKWVILNPAGENPFNKVIGNIGAGQYDLAMQSKLIAYDGKLYLYPLGFNGHIPSYRYDLYVYDPNIGVDGTWTNLGPAPDSNQHTYISMSAYKGKIYFFGGNSEKNRSEVTEYDIDKNTYRTLKTEGNLKPRERNGPALIVSEIVRKSGTENLTIPYLIVHGGAGMENSAAPVNGKFFYGLNDLWAFELPRYDEEGKEVIRPETYTWTELQKNTPRLVAGTEVPSTNESQKNVESDLRHIENRPADRGVHVFNYYDNKLFLTSGRDGTNDPHGGTHNGKKGLLYTLDPAKLFNDDENTTCSTVSIGTGGSEEPTNTICDAFSVYEALKTDYLNFNFSETLSGDLWFHNWNILGVFFNKSLESATR